MGAKRHVVHENATQTTALHVMSESSLHYSYLPATLSAQTESLAISQSNIVSLVRALAPRQSREGEEVGGQRAFQGNFHTFLRNKRSSPIPLAHF